MSPPVTLNLTTPKWIAIRPLHLPPQEISEMRVLQEAPHRRPLFFDALL